MFTFSLLSTLIIYCKELSWCYICVSVHVHKCKWAVHATEAVWNWLWHVVWQIDDEVFMAEPSTPVMATPSKNGQTAFTSDFRFVFSLGLGITCVTLLHSYIKNIHKVQQNIVIPCKCCPCLGFFFKHYNYAPYECEYVQYKSCTCYYEMPRRSHVHDTIEGHRLWVNLCKWISGKTLDFKKLTVTVTCTWTETTQQQQKARVTLGVKWTFYSL